MKRVLPLLVLVAAIGGGLYYYFNRPPETLQLTGVVTTHDVIVSPQIGGKIDQLLVQEGDEVAKDQLLAVIAPDELRADTDYYMHNVEGLTSQVQEAEAALRYEEQQTADAIRQAESTLQATQAQHQAALADLERARLEYDRTQSLSQQGVTPAQQLDEARTARDAAQARVDSLERQVEAQRAAVALARSRAEQVTVKRRQLQSNEHMQAAATAQQNKADVRLAYTEMHAPIAGLVDTRAARAGEVVTAGQPVLTIINPDDLWVRADVEESYIDRVRLGDKMTVRLPGGDEREGTVIFRGVDAGYATQRDVSRTKRDIKTFEIRLRCDNADRRLAVGMTAYVLLPLASVTN
jgi:HlyD family secretion protein